MVTEQSPVASTLSQLYSFNGIRKACVLTGEYHVTMPISFLRPEEECIVLESFFKSIPAMQLG